MAKLLNITDEKSKSIQKELKDLPKKDSRKNMKIFIDSISKEIQSALDKGYTLTDIVEILEKNGIAIKLSTLKSYLKKNDKNLETIKEDVLTQKVIVQPEKTVVAEGKSFTENFVRPDLPDDEL